MTQQYTPSRYISVADTAKLIRQELKTHFPGIKFSVKSHTYSMGGHVNVSYTDGPTEDQVNAAVRQFDGSTFDGMIDLKSYHDSTLNGETVHFGNDGTNVSRSYSVGFLTAIAKAYCDRYNKSMPVIAVSGDSAYILDRNYSDYHDYREEINRKAQKTDAAKIDGMFAEEDREIAEYTARREAQIAEVEGNRERIEKSPYTIKAVEEAGCTKYEVWQGQIYEGFNYTHLDSEITIMRLIKENPAYHVKNEREQVEEVDRKQELEELLPRLQTQLEGFTACNDTHAVEVLTKAIVKAEAELATYTQPEQPAPIIQAVVTIIEELPLNERRVRVLLAGEHTPFRALIGGEMAFYLKRYNAVLVDNATFDEVLNNRVAQ